MKIFVIDSEGYGHLNKLLPYCQSFYLVPDDQVEAVQKRFDEWLNSLGPCPDATEGNEHPLANHVCGDFVDPRPLPDFLQEPE